MISFSASIWDWSNPTWFAEYGAGVPAALLKTARGWVAAKVAFDDARAAGATEGEAIIASRRAVANVKD